jgi:hypothetical protein
LDQPGPILLKRLHHLLKAKHAKGALDVVAQKHKGGLGAHPLKTPEQKAVKVHGRLDAPKHRLHYLLAQPVEIFVFLKALPGAL